MKLTIQRHPTETQTPGLLAVEGKFFCYTLEDKDRDLLQSMSLAQIKKLKVYGETCIPYGKYQVQVTMSPKFKRPLPLITPVKGFLGIRIHRGRIVEHSLGCVLVGFGTEDNQLFKTKEAEDALVKLLGTEVHELEIIRK
jgi:hypothetical protein